MANITDARAIKFSNEQVRPLAEALRSLKARCAAAKIDWTANSNAIAGLFSANADVLVDSRAAEGVNQLTGLQVQQLIGTLDSVIAAINDQIVAVPCVRAFNANG
jgi:hypothetical protein